MGVLYGLRVLAANVYLRALTIHATAYNAAFQILTVNLVVYAVRERGVTAGGYGLALSAAGLGALAGTLTALRLAARLGYGPAFASALAFSTGAPLLIAILPGQGTGFAAQLALVDLAAGYGLGIANVPGLSVWQSARDQVQLAATHRPERIVHRYLHRAHAPGWVSQLECLHDVRNPRRARIREQAEPQFESRLAGLRVEPL
jgi:Na+/melibiose symporter-like transporter